MKTIDCAGCGATLDVSAFEPGTEFACGGCGGNLKVPERAAGPAKAARAGRKPAHSPKPPAPGSKKTVVVAACAGGAVLLGAVIFLVARPKAPPPAPPAPPVQLKPKEEPKKEVPPEEAEWAAAKTPKDQEAIADRRAAEARGSDAAAKELFRFLVAHGRADLATRAARARVEADPENAWGNESLGRVSAKAVFDELAPVAATLDLVPPEGWDRIKKRIAEKRIWVEKEEKPAYESDLASVRKQVKAFEDPWYKEALAVVASVRADPAYQAFLPIDFICQPPYLVMAQHQKDPSKMATVNVLGNHSKFFRCLTTEFLKLMGEAGLATPTVAEMGNPVLKAFVFTDRANFDKWHIDQHWPKSILEGVRAYYAWGGSQFMMLYDTGADHALQSDDTCTAFHEATHQLVQYYRRYYLTQKLRESNPSAPEVPLTDGRLNGDSHWFGEGFAEFFGAADRISSVTGEWKLRRPLQARIRELGDPIARKAEEQWPLADVIGMHNKMEMELAARTRWPDRFVQFNSLYYCHAWMLNHYLYFGKDGAYREKYLKIVHEEMTCHSGPDVFFSIMGAGEGEARKKWVEDLEDEIKDYGRKLFKSLNR